MCPGRVDNKWDRNFEEDLKIIKLKHRPDLVVSVITPNEYTQMGYPTFIDILKDKISEWD